MKRNKKTSAFKRDQQTDVLNVRTYHPRIMAENLESLNKRIKELEGLLAQQNGVETTRAKIEKMSAEVADTNPYRLA